MTQLDNHGQPLERAFNANRLQYRAIDELIGICRGVLVDGEVSQQEAAFLLDWMERNQDAAEQWPASVLYPRIDAMLSDGHLDPEESAELFQLLQDTTGDPNMSFGERVASYSTQLPLCDPPPDVEFADHSFCVTGRFHMGTRNQVIEAIESLGGSFHKGPTLSTDYLVIGVIGSTDWIHSTHGRKIEKAVKYRDERGKPLAIISEEHWTIALLDQRYPDDQGV